MGKENYDQMISQDGDDSLASEDQTFLPYRRQHHTRQRSSYVDIVWTTLMLLLLASGIGLVLIIAVKQLSPQSIMPDFVASSPQSLGMPNLNLEVLVEPCGNSPEEARERGCVFDNIAFAWFPERCWDEDLSKSFRDIKFKFALGPNNTDPVNQDDAYTGNYPHLFVNWEYHVMHCTYMWRKMHRAILGQGRAVLDGIAKDMQHTSHCETMLLRRQEVPYDSMNTIVSVKYPECGA